MKDLLFGSTTPHPVTEFQIKEELDRIERKIVAPIITLEIPVFEGLMLFNIEMGAIFVNLPMTVEEINRALSYAPDADWRVLLGKIVDHELAHKNQIDFLLNHGISIEQQNYLHYRYLKEFQASYAVPEPVRNQVCLQLMRKANAEQIEKTLERPSVWASSVTAFSREDIREIFGPYGAAEPMLELKDIAEKVRTKQDIVRYAPETKKLLGLPQKES